MPLQQTSNGHDEPPPQDADGTARQRLADMVASAVIGSDTGARDRVFTWLDEQGAVLHKYAKGSPWWAIRCPLVHEHPAESTCEASYLPKRRSPDGAPHIMCGHEHDPTRT